jgi:hypothetical protein
MQCHALLGGMSWALGPSWPALKPEAVDPAQHPTFSSMHMTAPIPGVLMREPAGGQKSCEEQHHSLKYNTDLLNSIEGLSAFYRMLKSTESPLQTSQKSQILFYNSTNS